MRGTGRGTSPSFQSNSLGFVQSGLEALYQMDVERRNLLRYSQAIDEDSGGWTFDASTGTYTVTANAAESPHGDVTATRFVTDSGAHALYNTNSIVVVPGEQYTFSFYAKNNGGTNAGYSVYDNSNSANIVAPTSYFSQISDTEWTRITVTFTAPAGCTLARIYPCRDTGDDVDIYLWGAQVNVGSTALPYVPTTNKQALYDYSGNGRHATRGSVGSAFICPVGEKHVKLPGTTGNSISTPNTTGGTAYYTITYLNGTTENGDTASGTVTIGGTTHSGNVKQVQVYSDSGRTTLVADFNPNRDAHGDVSRFTSSTTGEVWTISQASASDTNDPTWTGEGADFDATDDYFAGPTDFLPTGNAPLTMFSVFNRTDADGVVISYGGNNSRTTPHIIYTSGVNVSADVGGDGVSVGVPDDTIPLFLTFRHDGSRGLDIDVNAGAQKASKTLGGDANFVAANLRMGMYVNGGAAVGGTGSMWGIYSRDLSDAEIAQNHRAAKQLLAQRGVSI